MSLVGLPLQLIIVGPANLKGTNNTHEHSKSHLIFILVGPANVNGAKNTSRPRQAWIYIMVGPFNLIGTNDMAAPTQTHWTVIAVGKPIQIGINRGANLKETNKITLPSQC